MRLCMPVAYHLQLLSMPPAWLIYSYVSTFTVAIVHASNNLLMLTTACTLLCLLNHHQPTTPQQHMLLGTVCNLYATTFTACSNALPCQHLAPQPCQNEIRSCHHTFLHASHTQSSFLCMHRSTVYTVFPGGGAL
jgi:hypothetical protein